MPGTYTIAYLAASSAMKKKSFITLTPGVKVVKLCVFVAGKQAKYAKAFVLGKPFQSD